MSNISKCDYFVLNATGDAITNEASSSKNIASISINMKRTAIHRSLIVIGYLLMGLVSQMSVHSYVRRIKYVLYC